MNQELVALFQEDQRDRRAAGLHEAYLERDRARRHRATQIVAEGGLTCGDDYIMAALLFQHGETPDDYLQAHRLAVKAVELEAKDVAWLAATALDRHLVRQGRPAKYGTQNVRMGGVYRVPRIEPSTSDEERGAWGIPPLADILAQRIAPGRPAVTELGSLSVEGLQITVLNLPRPLTWHSEMLPDRTSAGLTAPSGRPVWVNMQGWHWAENESGEFELGWTEIPYAPELGHTVAQADRAELMKATVLGRPAIWVCVDEAMWTLYAKNSTVDAVLAVTGIRQAEVALQMERLLLASKE